MTSISNRADGPIFIILANSLSFKTRSGPSADFVNDKLTTQVANET